MRVLETQRLLLRRLKMDDVDDLLDIFSDPEAMRYYPATKNRREAENWVRAALDSYRKNGFGLWAAILKGSNEFAGQCGLVAQHVDGEEEVEIGYLFLRRFWGRGLATEAARACRDYGFEELGYARLISLIAPANRASRRVAGKIGMSLERETHKWGKTVYVYSISNACKR